MYTTSLIFSLGIWKHADFFLLNQMSHEMLHPFIIIILVKLNLDPTPILHYSQDFTTSRVAKTSQSPVLAMEFTSCCVRPQGPLRSAASADIGPWRQRH